MGHTRNAPSEQDVLAGLLDRLGLPIGLISPLLAHARAVEDDALKLGLVSPGDVGHVVARHSADSLLFALVRPPRPGETWVDAGTGAGFPGLVLACCYPSTGFVLVEPNRRRAGFLELQVADLGIVNALVEARRLEEIDLKFDVAVARALRRPADALSTLRSHLRAGGVALVAAGLAAELPPDATAVRLEGIDDVDSPGVLFMMGAAG